MSTTRSPLRRALTKGRALRAKVARLTLLKKAAFDKLTTHEKRVAIARDLLERLRQKRIMASRRAILRFARLDISDGSGYSIPTSAPAVQRILNKPNVQCPVCAKGALLASWIGNFDSFDGRALGNVDNNTLSTGLPSALVAVFGARLLSALEAAFEGKQFSWATPYVTRDEHHLLVDTFFNPHIAEPDNCLRAIYRNLIKHRGKLVVKDASGAKIVFD